MEKIKQAANEYAGINDDKYSNSAKAYDKYDLAIAFISGVEFAQRWISVEEELPKAYTWILCKCSLGDYYISCANAKGEIITQKGETITHWRPINLE